MDATMSADLHELRYVGHNYAVCVRSVIEPEIGRTSGRRVVFMTDNLDGADRHWSDWGPADDVRIYARGRSGWVRVPLPEK